MKKIISIAILLIFFNVAYSQVPVKAGLKKDNQKRETKEDFSKGAFYYEIKVIKNPKKKQKIKFPEIDNNSIKDEKIQIKVKQLLAFQEKINSSNIVFEMGKRGLRLVSHTFVAKDKDIEIHYYIFKL